MTLAKLLKFPVLVAEATGVTGTWIAEDESRFIQDRDLIAVFKLTVLVAAHQGVIDKGSVAGQVLQDGDHIPFLFFREEQKVTIGNGRTFDNQV